MSEENVELVGRFYEPATSKAELLTAMPRTMEFCHPEVEWTSREDGLTYRGREGVREALERWLESFDEYRYEQGANKRCRGSTSCSPSGTA